MGRFVLTWLACFLRSRCVQVYVFLMLPLPVAQQLETASENGRLLLKGRLFLKMFIFAVEKNKFSRSS